jgi:hypothetical protein
MRYIKKKAIHNRLFIVRISQAAFRKPVFIEDFSDDDPCTQTSFAVIRHTIPDDLFSSSDPNQIQKPFILKRILKMINIDPV